MESEFELPFFSLRDFTIDIIVAENKEDLLKFVPLDQNGILFHTMSEANIINNLTNEVFKNIKAYFKNFGRIPENGTFMANSMNVPLYMIQKMVDGEDSCMTIVCQLIETSVKAQKEQYYAFKFQN